MSEFLGDHEMAQTRGPIELFAAPHARRILGEVLAERHRQFDLHGEQSHLPDGTGPRTSYGMIAYAEQHVLAARARVRRGSLSGQLTFAEILAEEVAEARAEVEAPRLRTELIQVAAVCVQWVEAIDRRGRM